MKKLNLFSVLLALLLIASILAHAEPIQGGDKDTVWMKYTTQSAYMVKISKTNKYIAQFGSHTDIFDFNTGEMLKQLDGGEKGFFINSDQNFIRVGKDKKSVEILDANSWETIKTIPNDGQFAEYPFADVSNDEKFMVISNSDGFTIFDIQKQQFLKTKKISLYENQTGVNTIDVKFNCAGNVILQLAKTYKNNTVMGYFTVFDIQTLDSIDCLGNGSNFVISKDCSLMAICETSKVTDGVQIYDLNTKKLIWTLPTAGTTHTGMVFTPDNKYLYESNNNGLAGYGINVWDLSTGENHYKFQLYYKPFEQQVAFQSIDLSIDSKFIVSSWGEYLFKWTTDNVFTGIIDPKNPQKTIYPNPTNGLINFTVSIPSPSVTNISVVNSTGNTVMQLFNGMLNQGIQRLSYDVKGLPPGNYFVQIQNPKYSNIFKLIINK